VRTALAVSAHPDQVRRDTFDKRMAALRAHVSQVGENQNLEDQMRPSFEAVASEYGLPDGHLAEEFQVVDTS